MKRKNLVIFHLESIAWQTFNAFPEAFPNIKKLMPAARVYNSYFASATSTQMVLSYFFHANDFELDLDPGISKPVANNPSLFSLLKAADYQTEFLCVSAWRGKRMLPLLAETLGPVWSTNDFNELSDKFASITTLGPFAIYLWNLVSHIEHAAALTPYVDGLDEVVGGACAVADHAFGALLEILERKNLLDETTILIFGDHGDDYYTHGFKNGILHGGEPYSHVIHAPLVIRDASLPAGIDNRIASTVDLAPTILGLLGFSTELPFVQSGQSLLGATERRCAFSQNFAGSQGDAPDVDIRGAFSASDHSHTLLVSSRGLELFNYRLDPTNHTNLLHFFDLDRHGEIIPQSRKGFTHSHFATGISRVLGSERATRKSFRDLRVALKDHVDTKRSYIAERQPRRVWTLDPSNFDIINKHNQNRFFNRSDWDRFVEVVPIAAVFGKTSRPGKLIRRVRKSTIKRIKWIRRNHRSWQDA